MALIQGKLGDIPQDAVILSEKEALDYQTKILSKWKNSSDTFGFKYGSSVLVGSTVLTGLYLNNFLRGKLKLLHYGRASSYLPICVIPSAVGFLLHTEMVLKDVILQKTGTCPICLELRSAAIQAGCGFIFPFISASLSNLLLANKYVTARLPSLINEPGAVFKFMVTKMKPIQNILFAMFVGQALLGSAVTYFEAKSVYTVNEKLAKLEYDLEHKH